MVKRKGYLMDKVCTEENIELADKKARKGKTGSKKYIKLHDKDKKQENSTLLASFINNTYKTSKYTNEVIYEPKERIISKLPYYPDRVAHHAIMNVLKPIWIKQMVSYTYANIEGRGIHACKRDIEKILRNKSLNKDTEFYLKLDIRKFYPNIKHNVLKSTLKRKIKDKKMLLLLYEIIDSFEYRGKDKYVTGKSGLPLGNFPSAYECNLLLSSLDRWIKEELKCKYVFRYADDIVIFHYDKEYLHKVLICIKLYLKELYELQLKPNYFIAPVEKQPLNYVGYIFTHNYTKIRKSIKQRMRKIILKHSNKTIRYSKYKRIISSYNGWLSNADCR